MCAEPAYLVLGSGTVGQPFPFSEQIGCLPAGHTFSNAVISWGDGTTSPGALTAAGGEPLASVSVSAEHTYRWPGSFSISVEVTDDQTKEVVHHLAHVVASIAAITAPQETPPAPPPPPGGETGKSKVPTNSPGAFARLRARRFIAYRDVSRAGVVALLSTSLSKTSLRTVIHWGDGTSGPGYLMGSDGALRIRARHRWRRAGKYRIAVGVTNARGHFLAKTVSEVIVRGDLLKR